MNTKPNPVAWAVFAPNGNVRLWSTDSEAVRKFAESSGMPLTPLYDHPCNEDGLPFSLPLSDRELEQIAGRDELTGDAILEFAHRLLRIAGSGRRQKVDDHAAARANAGY